jgi:hypothetical protein
MKDVEGWVIGESMYTTRWMPPVKDFRKDTTKENST